MATAGEIVRRTAQALWLPEATVTSYYRVLREAGQLPTGGRGRSARPMTARDIARLLIGLMASDALAEAAEVTELVCRLRCIHFEAGESCPQLASVLLSGTFEEAVTLVVASKQAKREGRQSAELARFVGDSNIEIRVHPTELTAQLCIGVVEATFHMDHVPAHLTVAHEKAALTLRDRIIARASHTGMQVTRSINGADIFELVGEGTAH